MKTYFIPFVLVLTILFYLSGCKDDNSDSSQPFIIVLGMNPLYWALDEPYVDPGAEAYDITSVGDTINITDRLQVFENVDVYKTGTYQVTYNVSDTEGNTAEQKTREVKVVLTK